MFRKFAKKFWEFKNFAKITPAFFLPFFFIANDKIRKNHNFFFSSYTKNQLENRVSLIQYESNNPIEDRFNCTQIKEVEGYLISVFDGHGGWQVGKNY